MSPVPPDAFVNRELSWLEFNRRVLEEAQDPTVPLLERVKFLAIFSSNLDEFFMVRVAELKRRIRAGDTTMGPDELSPTKTLAAVADQVHRLVDAQHRCFLEELGPILASEGVRLVRPKEVTAEQERFLEDYFRRTLMPVLTPLAIDPGHPFPHLANRSLCLIVSVKPVAPSVLPHATLTVVRIPGQVVPRFVALPGPPGQHAFMLLEDVIRLQLPTLYTGYEIVSCHAIRVTRDAEIALPRKTAADLLTSVEAGVRERRMGDAVRLQYDADLPAPLLAMLVDELELGPDDLYAGTGFTAFSDLFQLYAAVDLPRLKDHVLPPRPVPAFEGAADIWSAIRAGDVLAHHPYHSFDAVTRFVSDAAEDPRVLAIKMTLYRVSPTSPIAQALTRAAENGKEVAVMVELQARFDEEANIRWARALEEVGAHVVYGLPGYKTHCKACLVVRQETDGIRRYCHLATGNYNVRTGGIYGDFSLFTCRESIGEDVTELFNMLTGYTRPRRFRHLLMAPTGMREAFQQRIRREAEHARRSEPARIVAKMNSLVDRTLIEELYAASQAGVRIDLIVRGICCLRPGIPGFSDRIRVISIVDRYLEHARAYYFHNGGHSEYWLASADWMPRNLDHRVEIAFPILDPRLQSQIREVLEIQLIDTSKAREIQIDGSSIRVRAPEAPPLRSQERLYGLVAAESRTS
ncbi:MAG TPA: polyphosphate kinase 1 [Candidatus Dormibacteraeota bacterium]|jgi:polyphosphate kinase|nr:polyphosphate kinase 1 [Methylomirabilota bacterium]HWN04248.1 polyphosphate kinase 1 [Candidatus Dormibacteraeota bacterium]